MPNNQRIASSQSQVVDLTSSIVLIQSVGETESISRLSDAGNLPTLSNSGFNHEYNNVLYQKQQPSQSNNLSQGPKRGPTPLALPVPQIPSVDRFIPLTPDPSCPPTKLTPNRCKCNYLSPSYISMKLYQVLSSLQQEIQSKNTEIARYVAQIQQFRELLAHKDADLAQANEQNRVLLQQLHTYQVPYLKQGQNCQKEVYQQAEKISLFKKPTPQQHQRRLSNKNKQMIDTQKNSFFTTKSKMGDQQKHKKQMSGNRNSSFTKNQQMKAKKTNLLDSPNKKAKDLSEEQLIYISLSKSKANLSNSSPKSKGRKVGCISNNNKKNISCNNLIGRQNKYQYQYQEDNPKMLDKSTKQEKKVRIDTLTTNGTTNARNNRHIGQACIKSQDQSRQVIKIGHLSSQKSLSKQPQKLSKNSGSSQHPSIGSHKRINSSTNLSYADCYFIDRLFSNVGSRKGSKDKYCEPTKPGYGYSNLYHNGNRSYNYLPLLASLTNSSKPQKLTVSNKCITINYPQSNEQSLSSKDIHIKSPVKLNSRIAVNKNNYVDTLRDVGKPSIAQAIDEWKSLKKVDQGYNSKSYTSIPKAEVPTKSANLHLKSKKNNINNIQMLQHKNNKNQMKDKTGKYLSNHHNHGKIQSLIYKNISTRELMRPSHY